MYSFTHLFISPSSTNVKLNTIAFVQYLTLCNSIYTKKTMFIRNKCNNRSTLYVNLKNNLDRQKMLGQLSKTLSRYSSNCFLSLKHLGQTQLNGKILGCAQLIVFAVTASEIFTAARAALQKNHFSVQGCLLMVSMSFSMLL